VIFAVIAAAERGSAVRTGYKKNPAAFKTWDELDADEMEEMRKWKSVPVNDDLRVELRLDWCEGGGCDAETYSVNYANSHPPIGRIGNSNTN